MINKTCIKELASRLGISEECVVVGYKSLSKDAAILVKLRYQDKVMLKDLTTLLGTTAGNISNKCQVALNKIKRNGLVELNDMVFYKESYERIIKQMSKHHNLNDKFGKRADYILDSTDKIKGIDFVVETYFNNTEKEIFDRYFRNSEDRKVIAKDLGITVSMFYHYTDTDFANKLFQYRGYFIHGYNKYLQLMDEYIEDGDDNMPIEYLFINNRRAYGSLIMSDIHTMKDLRRANDPAKTPLKYRTIADVKGIGVDSYNEIYDRMINWKKYFSDNYFPTKDRLKEMSII